MKDKNLKSPKDFEKDILGKKVSYPRIRKVCFYEQGFMNRQFYYFLYPFFRSPPTKVNF